MLGASELPKGAEEACTPNVVNDCKLEPKEKPGNAEGIEDELNKGKLELGRIEGKDEEYNKGNELEAKGTPLLINGNNEGVTLREAKGNSEVVNK